MESIPSRRSAPHGVEAGDPALRCAHAGLELALAGLGDLADPDLLVEAVVHLRVGQAGQAGERLGLELVLLAELLALLPRGLAGRLLRLAGGLRAGRLGQLLLALELRQRDVVEPIPG